MKYFLVGIKGSGMSALAVSLKDMGEMVIGSDKKDYYFTEENLNKNKIPYFYFNKMNIERYKNYHFIISYAYDESNNEEVKEIIEKGYQYSYYSDFINEYYKKKIIGVSGTHGKTTVCTLLKWMLEKDNVSYIIGDGQGKGKKDYEFLILEACEYKYHFIKYDYEYLIINNIDYDHPDFYNDINEVYIAFRNASKKAKCIIVNNDDKNAKKIKHNTRYTFGINNKSFVTGTILLKNEKGFTIKINVKNNEFIFKLPFQGIHMVYNFLASFTLYYLLHNKKTEMIEEEVDKSISKYISPNRRMKERKLDTGNIIIDDYAHHPTEIECTYNAIKQKYKNYDITIVFQPHTISRTIFLYKEFQDVFENKNVYIMKTFLSREEDDPQKRKVIEEIFIKQNKYSETKIKEILLKKNQIIVFMGAGNISNEIHKYI